MKKLQKDLQDVEKSLNKLAQKTKQMAKKLDKLEKPKAARKPRARAKAAKKVVRKKSTRVSATDNVLAIIKRSREGIDTAALKKKTGFKDNNVRAILSRLKKQGKIKSARKGVYEKA